MINKNEPILLSLVRFAKGQEQDNAFAESVFRILKKTSVIKFLNKKNSCYLLVHFVFVLAHVTRSVCSLFI